jgi:hypothetical protein
MSKRNALARLYNRDMIQHKEERGSWPSGRLMPFFPLPRKGSDALFNFISGWLDWNGLCQRRQIIRFEWSERNLLNPYLAISYNMNLERAFHKR